MSKKKDRVVAPIPPHRILRECLRHYIEFREYVAQHGGDGVIEHGYWVYNDDGTRDKITISISFWDLFHGIKKISPRKRQALWHNVIEDKLQREVADIMGISTVSVGQYVDQACLTLAKNYFNEDTDHIVIRDKNWKDTEHQEV